MRTLEVRRHSMRKTGGGSQLSQEGVAFARRLGATMGPYACVVASVVPRARETAIAMGFAVDYELVTLELGDAMAQEMADDPWWVGLRPFAAGADLLAARGPTWRYASAMAALWRDLLNSIPDGSAALVIGHSGELELTLLACFPHADHATWGPPFGPCEGARLIYDGEPAHFASVSLIRTTV